jgi:hypothetical protein
MSDDFRKQIYNTLKLKETDELVEIWKINDRVEWSELAFDVIREILQQRLGEIPPQDEPVYEHVEQDTDDKDDDIPTENVNFGNVLAITSLVFGILLSAPMAGVITVLAIPSPPGSAGWRFVDALENLVIDVIPHFLEGYMSSDNAFLSSIIIVVGVEVVFGLAAIIIGTISLKQNCKWKYLAKIGVALGVFGVISFLLLASFLLLLVYGLSRLH